MFLSLRKSLHKSTVQTQTNQDKDNKASNVMLLLIFVWKGGKLKYFEFCRMWGKQSQRATQGCWKAWHSTLLLGLMMCFLQINPQRAKTIRNYKTSPHALSQIKSLHKCQNFRVLLRTIHFVNGIGHAWYFFFQIARGQMQFLVLLYTI